MELLDQMVILCLTFWGTAKLFSIAATPFYISTSNVRVPISPHFYQHLLFSFFFLNNNHPRRYEVVSHYSFGLHLAQRVKRLSAMQERPGFDLWVGKIPWRRKWQPTPVLLPGKSHGRRSLVGYSPWGRKESDTTEWLHLHSLAMTDGVSLVAQW